MSTLEEKFKELKLEELKLEEVKLEQTLKNNSEDIQFLVINCEADIAKLFDDKSRTLRYLKVESKELRKLVHIKAREQKLLARTFYECQEKELFAVKCDNCQQYSSVDDSHNTCCPNGMPCNSTEYAVDCQYCDKGDVSDEDSDLVGKIVYDVYDDPHENPGKLQYKKKVTPTSMMVLLTPGTAYKHINFGKQGSFRKRYKVKK